MAGFNNHSKEINDRYEEIASFENLIEGKGLKARLAAELKERKEEELREKRDWGGIPKGVYLNLNVNRIYEPDPDPRLDGRPYSGQPKFSNRIMSAASSRRRDSHATFFSQDMAIAMPITNEGGRLVTQWHK